MNDQEGSVGAGTQDNTSNLKKFWNIAQSHTVQKHIHTYVKILRFSLLPSLLLYTNALHDEYFIFLVVVVLRMSECG